MHTVARLSCREYMTDSASGWPSRRCRPSLESFWRTRVTCFHFTRLASLAFLESERFDLRFCIFICCLHVWSSHGRVHWIHREWSSWLFSDFFEYNHYRAQFGNGDVQYPQGAYPGRMNFPEIMTLLILWPLLEEIHLNGLLNPHRHATSIFEI